MKTIAKEVVEYVADRLGEAGFTHVQLTFNRDLDETTIAQHNVVVRRRTETARFGTRVLESKCIRTSHPVMRHEVAHFEQRRSI